MNDDIPSRGNLLSVEPHDLAKPAPDTIAPDCAAQRLLHAPPEAAVSKAIGAKKNGEFTACSSPAVPVHRIVFGAA
jgi:hypothetical protein